MRPEAFSAKKLDAKAQLGQLHLAKKKKLKQVAPRDLVGVGDAKIRDKLGGSWWSRGQSPICVL